MSFNCKVLYWGFVPPA